MHRFLPWGLGARSWFRGELHNAPLPDSVRTYFGKPEEVLLHATPGEDSLSTSCMLGTACLQKGLCKLRLSERLSCCLQAGEGKLLPKAAWSSA